MGSENKKLNHETLHHDPIHHTPAKLSLVVPSRTTTKLPDIPTPPRRTTVSVPFQWEEAPGKPRPCHTQSEPKVSDDDNDDVSRTLELPPRLLFLDTKVSKSMPSPTTVLDGPHCVQRVTSFTTSFWDPKETALNGNFGSNRWSSGSKKNRGEEIEGDFDFSSWIDNGTSKVKITRVRRRGSFFRNSQGRSLLWESIYEGFKQVIPWKSRQGKQRK